MTSERALILISQRNQELREECQALRERMAQVRACSQRMRAELEQCVTRLHDRAIARTLRRVAQIMDDEERLPCHGSVRVAHAR